MFSNKFSDEQNDFGYETPGHESLNQLSFAINSTQEPFINDRGFVEYSFSEFQRMENYMPSSSSIPHLNKTSGENFGNKLLFKQ